MESELIVSVNIHSLQTTTPLTGVIVRAYDVDLRREELLGEAQTDQQGYCEIRYRAEQFARAEKQSADLRVRVYTPEGVLLAESEVRFNAKSEETFEFTVEMPEPPRLYEYEQLRSVLAPVLQELPLAELTEQDIEFLVNELRSESVVNRRRLRLLAHGARLVQDSRLPTELFYGLARVIPLSSKEEPEWGLDTILALPPSEIRQLLLKATERIIPARLRDEIEAILAQLEQLKLEKGLLVQRPMSIQLTNVANGRPLAGYRARATYRGTDQESQELGQVVVTRSGLVNFSYLAPPDDQKDSEAGKLSLLILNEEGQPISNEPFEVEMKTTEDEALAIKVPADLLPQPVSLSQANLNLPPDLLTFLESEAILIDDDQPVRLDTLEDVRNLGGLSRIKNLPLALDDPIVRKLQAHADLSLLSADLAVNETLIEAGYTSVKHVAGRPRANFIEQLGPQLGDFNAARLHVEAQAQSRFLNNVLMDLKACVADGRPSLLPELTNTPPSIAEWFVERCQCPDCLAAVSPAAYVADLFDYAVTHVKEAGDYITLERLGQLLHQPFGDLPASCAAVQQQVRQVHLCIEVLRAVIPSEARPLLLESGYREAAYANLLTRLGTSLAELRLARRADETTRQELADQLGIAVEHLNALLIDTSSDGAERELEVLFGLPDTTREPLSAGPILGEEGGQIVRWGLDGVVWNQNTSPDGSIFLDLRTSGSTYVAQLYGDAAWTKLVASGQRSTPQGEIPLLEESESGLSGYLEIDYHADTSNIELVAVPRLLSWRLARLRTQWLAQEWPEDAYSGDERLPYIDPDLLGPDDFRSPLIPTPDTGDLDTAFDIWVKRRRWVDAQLQSLRDADTGGTDRVTATLAEMNQALNYPGGSNPISWAAKIQVAQLLAIQERLNQPSERESAEKEIAQQLKLTLEGFNRLLELVTLDEDAIEEDEWAEIYSILVQAQKVTLSADWRREEDDLASRLGQVLFGPKAFWLSISEPLEGSWPPTQNGDRPWIDPDRISVKKLPDPTAGARARALWQTRRQELEELTSQLRVEHKVGGVDALLDLALGVPPDSGWKDELNTLRNRLQRGDELDTVAEELARLHLTAEELARLVEIIEKADITEAEEAEVYAILTTAQKERTGLPAVWLAEEAADPLLGNRYWFALKARLPKWRASAADRQGWQQALRQRSRAPIIDPDLITIKHLSDEKEGAAYPPYNERQNWLNDDTLARIQARRTGSPESDPLFGFDLILAENLFETEMMARIQARLANTERSIVGLDTLLSDVCGAEPDELISLQAELGSADEALQNNARTMITEELGLNYLGLTRLLALRQLYVDNDTVTPEHWRLALDALTTASVVQRFLSLARTQEAGEAIAAQIEQFSLTRAAFDYLLQTRALLARQESLSEAEWEDVYQILTQVRKRRQSGDWCQSEQTLELTLSPDYFKVPEPPALQFPPPEPPPLPAWRAEWRDRRDWEEMLETRIEQEQALMEGLKATVSLVEEETLPMLRDALITTTRFVGELRAKAEGFTDRYLIDAQASGCQVTTRVGQAIETVQSLLWSIRTAQLAEGLRALTLDAVDFDGDWQWIGSYATWRASMFVYMYPENILMPGLRRHQTPAFKALVEATRNNRGFTPEAACEAAQVYSDYLEDVCALRVEATCTAATRIHRGDGCERGVTPLSRDLFYMFGRGGKTNTIYWSAYDPEKEDGYTQTFWEVVPGQSPGNIVDLIGATPYEITPEKRIVCLFIRAREEGQQKLLVVRYNLEDQRWENEPIELELPLGAATWSIRLLRYQIFTEPPVVFLSSRIGVFARRLNKEGTDWKEAGVPAADESSESENDWRAFTIAKGVAEHLIVTLHEILRAPDGNYWIFYTDLVGTNRIIRLQLEWTQPITLVNPEHAHFEETNLIWQGAIIGGAGNDVLAFFERSQLSYFYRISFGPTDIEINGPYLTTELRTPLYHIVPDFGSDSIAAAKRLVVAPAGVRLGVRGFRQPTFYQLKVNTTTEDLFPELLSPVVPLMMISVTAAFGYSYATRETPFDIHSTYSAEELQSRREVIQATFEVNDGDLVSNLAYFEEAYYFVPIQLALQLQRQGYYAAALEWFRSVFDYSARYGYRKISYLLRREDRGEEGLADILKRAKDWLQDPLNPHTIAATRTNTYTRFTLMALVRCLLDYADAEFTRDTGESLARARILYTTALDILDLSFLQQQLDGCEALIATLEIEIGEEIAASEPALLGKWAYITDALQAIDDRRILEATVGAVMEVLREAAPWEERLDRAREKVPEPLPTPTPHPSFHRIVTEKAGKLANAYSALLSQPFIADAATRAGLAVGYDLERAAEVATGLTSEVLTQPSTELEWLRRPPIDGAGFNEMLGIMEVSREYHTYDPTPSYYFCVPRNPVLEGLRLRAELNLYKLRTCRNIAGMERQLDPYAAPTDTVSGLPQIGAGGSLVLPGAVTLQPTPYRYQVLVERAKQLAQMAGQMESAMLSTLERRDAEAYQLLQARQNLEVGRAGLRLQDLRVREAEDGVELAELQRDRAQIQVDTYGGWIEAGMNEWEQKMIDGYENVEKYSKLATGFGAAARISEAWDNPFASFMIGAEAIANYFAISSQIETQIASVWASFERRKQEWELAKALAEQDKLISSQQIRIVQDHVRIVGQERKIAQMQADHADHTLEFLNQKFTNVELYDWMGGVLEGVYSFFLQQATAVAKLAENQLAFERQEVPPAVIQVDYWAAPDDSFGAGDGESPDRLGLTGSARLLQDIYQLDQHAFKTDKRKLQLTKTISLARLAPVEFQRFRETGVMTFATPLEMFDRDFPGHYLRLIKRVRTSVIALIPPTQGIHATLSTAGLSRVVIGGDIYQTVPIRRSPESVALTAPSNATGLFELEQQSEMLFPFESTGVAATWELHMPKAANRFDYSTIADVLLTLEYTALDSYLYRQQVVQQLDTRFSADRPFSFRQEFADQWYDLNNPEQTATPMVVRFRTRREDFPPNLTDLKIQKVLIYFVRREATFEAPLTDLRFIEAGAGAPVGGSANPVEGIISTQSGSAGSWTPMTGKPPFGEWTLTLPNTELIRQRFKNEEIEDILLVITYRGRTPEWPESA